MINSMTGFGSGHASSNEISLTVECKSVNNRYLDISLRLPRTLQCKELKLKELIQTKVGRGSLNLQITIDKAEKGKPDVAINKELAKGYKKLLNELRDTAEIDDSISLSDLMEFDAIFDSQTPVKEKADTLWPLILQATEDSLKELNQMRRQEGKQLQQDIYERIEHIEKMLKNIQKLIKNRAAEMHQHLLDRIQNLVDDNQIDEDRLEMEVAILVDKIDITEEIIRLQSHIKFFKEALDTDIAVGRRLKFLCQEMNREINTIGSKCNHSQISQLVVQSKESLEQIREQVFNIE